MKRIVQDRLTGFLTANNLINDSQDHFPSYSTFYLFDTFYLVTANAKKRSTITIALFDMTK